jgi:Phospholipase_D-nuclease N-terminal
VLLAYDFPLLGVFWSFLFIAVWVAWLLLLVHVIVDIFRRRDLRGVAKAGWLMLILFLPIVGVVGYTVIQKGQIGQDVEHLPAYRR